jgi:DNA repair protein RecO (recombination protein O)
VRSVQTQAVVLGRRPRGEADLVLDLLTREAGRLQALAPSGRRSRRRFGGCLEPFGGVEVVLREGRGGLWRLEEARLLEAHLGLRADLVTIGQAAYVCELVGAAVREGEEAASLLARLEGTLSALDEGPLEVAGLRRFELDLLGLLGLAPRLVACLACGATEATGWRFAPEEGGVLCARCAGPSPGQPLSLETLGWLRALQRGEEPPAPDAEASRAARELLDQLLARLLGRPLRSRSFLEALAREAHRG